MTIFYFGCMDRAGHYMHAPLRASQDARLKVRDLLRTNPWGTSVDGGLCLGGPQVEGIALLHRRAGWTAVAFWDRSVDHRGNSCSVFLAEGEHDFDGVLGLAREFFPKVMGRFSFPIVSGEALTQGEAPR